MKNNNWLKIMALAAVIFTVTGLQSCTKGLQSLHFNLGMQTQTVTVTVPVTPAGNVTIPSISSTYNVDSFIKASTGNQLGIQNISSVKLASCVLVLNNPPAGNSFGNFQSCTASFSSNTNSTPYVLTIADNPDVVTNTLSLPVDANAELKSYLGNQFTYDLSGVLRHPITAPLTCTVTFTYSLVVQG